MGGSVLAALSSVQRRNKQCQLFSWETTSETLSAFMSEYGKVVSCDTGVTRNGRTRGWAIVEMSSAAEAQAAIASGSGQDLEGRPLNIRLDQGKQEKSEKPKRAPRGDGERRGGDPSLEGKAENSSGLQVVVRNLPWSVTSEMLRGTFEQIGKVQNAGSFTTPILAVPKGGALSVSPRQKRRQMPSLALAVWSLLDAP